MKNTDAALFTFLIILFLSPHHIGIHAQRTFLDSLLLRPSFRVLRTAFFAIGRNQSPDDALKHNLKINKVQRQFCDNETFFCDVKGPGARSSTIPDSVHRLRPGDIDIIGGIGDSLTAGNGGMSVNTLQIAIENRGLTFSIGGDKTWRQYLTIPNILKEFNPNLYGYSHSDGVSTFKSSKFNVAELGAMSRDMPHMSKVLIQRMYADPNVDIKNHWKLISMLIGSNDICIDICYHQNPEEIVANHEKDLLKVLRSIRDNLPRTMFNIMLMPPLRVLVEFKGKPSICEPIHNFECPCFFGLKFEHNRQRYYKIIENWNRKVVEVANRSEFHQKTDFTVNVQPTVSQVIFPRKPNGDTDFTYMSNDCFHLSQKGHALAANGLWNNMLEPEGRKSVTWKGLFEEFHCPTYERPFLATRFN